MLNIIRDNREQKGWGFEEHNAIVTDETITTGDYTLPELCTYDESKNTYIPEYAIERKSGNDLVSSLTRDRGRFKKEIKRAEDWNSKLLVLIEEPEEVIRHEKGFMQYRDVHPNQIFGSIEKWERYYNVEFRFVGGRLKAQQVAYDTLSTRLRASIID